MSINYQFGDVDAHGAALADDYFIFTERGEKASLVGMVETLQEEIKALKEAAV